MFTRVRAAAVTFRPWPWHPEWNADRLEEAVRCAAHEGAKLIVAPESVLDGGVTNACLHYPHLRRRIYDVALTHEHPLIKRFRRLARALQVQLVFGYAERSGKRDVYNAAVCISASGRICGAHRKMRFAEGYKAGWYFNRLGTRVRAFDTPLGRHGILLCFDRWHADLVEALVQDGARALCIPTYGTVGPQNTRTLLAHARAYGIPIVQANVGGNLIISRGEVVAEDRRLDAVTIADIEIPRPVSSTRARSREREILQKRKAEMKERLLLTRARAPAFRANDPHDGCPPKPRAGAFVIRDHTTDKKG